MRRWKYLFIIGVLLYSAYSLIPTVRYYSMSEEAKKDLSVEDKAEFVESAIKLGLDLQGGMHLVYEIDDSKLSEDDKKDAVDRAIRIIRNRIDQFGVAEPVIQKQGDKRIIVEVPGVQDPERVKKLIGDTALLEFKMVVDDIAPVLRDLDRALKGVEVVGSRVDSTAAGEDTVAALSQPAIPSSDTAPSDTVDSPFDSLLPTLPGTEDVEIPLQDISSEAPFTSYLVSGVGGAVVVDDRNKRRIDLLLQTPQAQRVIPRKTQFHWEEESRPIQGGGTGRLLYLVEEKPIITGSLLKNATTRPDPDDPSSLNVSFTLDREGALIFSRVTGENIGRRLAIVLDSVIVSAPTIQTKIPGGEGRITGGFDDAEANDLAIVLRAGALPAPLEVQEERTVGPTLGRDSIVLGIKAAALGFVLVMVFMLIYYKLSGILACFALMLNLVIVLAVLAQLHAALTLPGIAGFILTIGMAVDANVLIFERVREELAKAKTVRSAIDSGYERALTTIVDANITTLITAFVLWQFGTGPIKGFATTLSIGIVVSMFTALLCTRVVFELITSKWQLKKLSI